MATYSYAQLEGLWVSAGGSRAVAPLMAAIALAESGGRSDAVGHNTNGSTDTGLWQINSVHHVSGMTDPAKNASEALKIYKSQGLQAWTTYTSGAYRRFLKQGVSPVTTGATGSTSTAQDASGLGDVWKGTGILLGNGANSLGGSIGSGFGAALSALFTPIMDIIIWGTEAILGMALMTAGLLIMVSGTKTVRTEEDEASKAALDIAAPEAGIVEDAEDVKANKQAEASFRKAAKTEDVKVAHSSAEFKAIRQSGYSGKIRHDY